MRIETFKQRLNSTLRDNAINRYIGNRAKGKIDFNSVYKIAYNKKIFKQKEERKGKDYSVTFLVDISGSMEGSRIDVASQAVQEFVIALKKIDIPTRVYCFSNDVYKVDCKDEDIAYQIEELCEDIGSGTHDAYALHVVGNEICKLNKANLLVVLTDGAGDNIKTDDPRVNTNGVRWIDLKNTKSVINGLHKKYEDLEIVCLSIYSNHAPGVYGSNRTIIINDLDETKPALVKLFGRVIKRG